MLSRNKEGKLIVTTRTVSKAFLKTMNRKARRSHLNRSRYVRTRIKCEELIKDLKPLTFRRMPKTQGKYLTGFYSELKRTANLIVLEN